jgi:hypothetical protein
MKEQVKSAPRTPPKKFRALPASARVEAREGSDLCCGFCRGRLNQRPLTCPACGVGIHKNCHKERGKAQNDCITIGCETSLDNFVGADRPGWLRRMLSRPRRAMIRHRLVRRRGTRGKKPRSRFSSEQRRRRMWRPSGLTVAIGGGFFGAFAMAIAFSLSLSILMLTGLIDHRFSDPLTTLVVSLGIGGVFGTLAGGPMGALIAMLKARRPELSKAVPRNIGAGFGLITSLYFGLAFVSPTSNLLLVPMLAAFGIASGWISGNILDDWVEDL